MPEPVVQDLADLRFSPTAALFEGETAGAGISMFVLDTPPGGLVELHTHPYPETFVLLEGSGRWTAGTAVIELRAGQVLVVPAETLHGFRNTGDAGFRLVSVHESPTLQQTFTDREPA